MIDNVVPSTLIESEKERICEWCAWYVLPRVCNANVPVIEIVT